MLHVCRTVATRGTRIPGLVSGEKKNEVAKNPPPYTRTIKYYIVTIVMIDGTRGDGGGLGMDVN